MKKTTVMFRMLDNEWTSVLPQRRDCRQYRGSNYENENFHGGRSVIFALPEATFEEKITEVDVQFYVYKEVSKYFEMETRQNFGFTIVRVDDLFNSIIKDLRERKELAGYISSSLERQPISRSMRGTYPLLDEDLRNTGATIELFVRLSYLGVCVTTEIESLKSNRKSFQAREDTDQGCPYQFREVSPEEIGVRPTDQLGDELRKVAGISLATVEDGTGMDKSELQARTASKRGKRGRKKNGEGEEESDEMRLKRLQALLKKSRRGAACSVGIVDKPRKSCPPSSYPHICEVPPAAPICGYLQPCGVFSILCQQPFDYCHSVAQPIPCFNPV